MSSCFTFFYFLPERGSREHVIGGWSVEGIYPALFLRFTDELLRTFLSIYVVTLAHTCNSIKILWKLGLRNTYVI